MKLKFFSPRIKLARASHRIRGDVSAQTLTNMGIEAVANNKMGDVDSNTLFVGLKNTMPENLLEAKRLGATTVYDLCDNKFDEKAEYLPCCRAADIITVNSKLMADSVRENTGRDSIIIPDPYERPELDASFNTNRPIKLLWYGSSASLKFVNWVQLWQRLEREVVNYHFTIVVAKADRLAGKMKSRQQRGAFSGVNFDKISILNWTWELQGELLKDTDIVLIPVESQNYRTDTKSANRLIDGLMSGNFVVTTPLSSYVEFEPYTWQKDYVQGIKWAQEHPGKVIDRIKQGQEYTRQRYSKEIIAQKWLEVAQNAFRR